MRYPFIFAFVTVSWGGSYLAIRYMVEAFPPIFGAVLRVACTAVIMAAWLRAREGRWVLRGRYWGYGALVGIFSMGLSWGLLFWGELHVAPAVSAILVATTPIFTALFLPLIDRRIPLGPRQRFGIPLGFLGVVLVFVPHLGAERHDTMWGLLAVLATAVLYGIATALQQPLSRRVGAQRALLWQCIGALLCLVPLSWLAEPWPTWAALAGASRGLWALLYLTICSTVLAFQGWYYLIRMKGSVVASTVVYCAPVVSVLLDALVLRTVPHWSALVGATIIFASVALTQRGRKGGQEPAGNVQDAKWGAKTRAMGGG